MAVEAQRGCGYRKVGGLYLVSGGLGAPCDRLPFPLHVCPTCAQGIKQSRGWQWVNGFILFGGVHLPENCNDRRCPLCQFTEQFKSAGLLWVGEKFYKRPNDFVNESRTLGVSRRIKAIPHGMKLGETWVLLGHSKAVYNFTVPVSEEFVLDGQELIKDSYTPGIFQVFKPSAVELIVTKRQLRDETFLENLKNHQKKTGVEIKTVIVPEDDPDHQGKNGDDGDDDDK